MYVNYLHVVEYLIGHLTMSASNQESKQTYKWVNQETHNCSQSLHKKKLENELSLIGVTLFTRRLSSDVGLANIGTMLDTITNRVTHIRKLLNWTSCSFQSTHPYFNDSTQYIDQVIEDWLCVRHCPIGEAGFLTMEGLLPKVLFPEGNSFPSSTRRVRGLCATYSFNSCISSSICYLKSHGKTHSNKTIVYKSHLSIR